MNLENLDIKIAFYLAMFNSIRSRASIARKDVQF